MSYPKGAIEEAIAALELAYSYLRELPATEVMLANALDLLYRARELEEGVPHPYRVAVPPNSEVLYQDNAATESRQTEEGGAGG